MSDRWVCKRCYADNEGTAFSCAKCGLARGSEVTATDQQAWASSAGVPAPGAEPARPAWQSWLRFWWIPVLAIVLLVGWFTAARRGDDGSLTSGGTVSVTDLRPGDCFYEGEAEEISEVDGGPCDEPHDSEVFAVQDRDGETYPTDAEFDAIFQSVCAGTFETYVGTAYDDSVLYAGMITPSEDSWNDGDREYVCYLYEPLDPNNLDAGNVELTTSMEGAAR